MKDTDETHDKTNRATRINGSSFGGIMMLTNGRNDEQNSDSPSSMQKPHGATVTSSDKTKLAKIERMKQARRRRSISLSTSMNSAQSDQIKDILEKSVGSKVSGVLVDGPPEERLQHIMTTAKERGLSLEEIFSYFHGGHTGVKGITKQTFLSALEKLGNKLFVLTDEELSSLVKRFDLNNDGLISLAEFKKYCLYEIPHVSWKAERSRREATGEMAEIRAKIDEERRGNATTSNKMYSYGLEFCETSKLFWKINFRVDIRMFYCHELDVVTIQISDHESNRALPTLYAKKKSCDNISLGKDLKSDPRDKGDKEDIELKHCAQYLLSRLQVRDKRSDSKIDAKEVILTKLSGT